MKFYLIAGTFAVILLCGGFYLGWSEGREKFANECIAIGNFTVFDYGNERHRRFKCTEVPYETPPPVKDQKTSL